jgi:hypothetical protein
MQIVLVLLRPVAANANDQAEAAFLLHIQLAESYAKKNKCITTHIWNHVARKGILNPVAKKSVSFAPQTALFVGHAKGRCWKLKL